ncbi:MAG: response regulator [Alphaproteobacteria bacterium]|nr:response regulator [Alphaproteobacteria bacterium]
MKGHILVVDDIPANLRLLEAKLLLENFRVTLAESGKKALEILADQAIDLILLDVMMPEMDGFELCQRIRKQKKLQNLPIVMVTAFGDIQHRVRSLEVGADDFLTKPINDIALFARIKSLLQLKFLTDQLHLREKTLSDFYLLPTSNFSTNDEIVYDNILLIHEANLAAEKIKKTLEEIRCHVDLVTNKQSLENVGSKIQDYAVIILSLSTTENGLELLSILRSDELTRRIPVLLTADESQLNKVVIGLEMGATDYFLRPVEKAEVLLRCRTQVRKSLYQERLKTIQNKSVSTAFIDEGTGLYNKKYLIKYLDSFTNDQAESKRNLSIAILSFMQTKAASSNRNSFDLIEKTAKEVSKKIVTHLSVTDLLIRLSQFDFAVIMNNTPVPVALQFTTKIKNHLTDLNLTKDQGLNAIKLEASIIDTGKFPNNKPYSQNILEEIERIIIQNKQFLGVNS